MERDAADRAREAAVDELRRRGDPAIDVRLREAAPLEASLARSDESQIGTVEAAFAEYALPPAREQGLQPLVEELAAEVAALERAAVGCKALERRAAEVRIADRDAIECEDALHAKPREALSRLSLRRPLREE